jgi:hypothetical protein
VRVSPCREIDPDSLEIMEKLGEGEFGVVHKAKWCAAGSALSLAGLVLPLGASRPGLCGKQASVQGRLRLWSATGRCVICLPLLSTSFGCRASQVWHARGRQDPQGLQRDCAGRLPRRNRDSAPRAPPLRSAGARSTPPGGSVSLRSLS